MISQGHFRITLKIYLYKRHFNSRLRRSKGKTRSSSRDRHLQRRGSLKRAEESSTANRLIDVKVRSEPFFSFKKCQHEDGEYCHEAQHAKISIVPFKLRHIIEVHPVDTDDER
jgi:hypothetical protein